MMARDETADSRRILIVEDNAELLTIMEELLSEEYEVATATAGEEGIERARQFRPEVVIMDVQLPRMSGLDAARAIKAERAPDPVRILALTALSLEDLADGMVASGWCDAFLHKPVTLDKIRSMVEELLDPPSGES